MPKLKIDGQEIEFEAGMSVIQVCDQAGIEIPRFCYHEKLEIAGNCRMCLVEVKPGPPKPQASCALPAAEGQEIFTKSPMVKKAREGVMEMLLINHPLDCPICDQGGECDLQDQAVAYGCGNSRYHEHKRAVEDKYMGPLIKTQMTRCIHCTRCVRFSEDVAGVPEVGAIFRGENMQITTYLEQAMTSEMSANVIDLCPVGALTSRPYAFVARPWELRKTESIDVMDALGSNIRIDSRGEAVLRILPRLNDDVNEEWISDKTRYACDGLRNQRLDRPYIRRDGKLHEASWDEALALVAEKLTKTSAHKIAALAGNLADMESTHALRELMLAIGTPHLDCRQDGSKIEADDAASWLFNSGIAGIEQADVVLLVGCNPRHEAPVLNARLRKAYLQNGAQFYNIGSAFDLTFPVQELGNNPHLLNLILNGDHELTKVLSGAKHPAIIVGAAAVAREDGASVMSALKVIAEQCGVVKEGWNGFNMLHYAAARAGGMSLGFVPQEGGKDVAGIIEAIDNHEIEMVYLLGVDEIDMRYFGDAFVIYQGHHGDIGAHRADVVLPGAAYTEKNAWYMNTEGRLQEAFRAVFPVGQAREDWKIIRAISGLTDHCLSFDTLEALRADMRTKHASLPAVDGRFQPKWKKAGKLPKNFRLSKDGFEKVVLNFYMTDPISRASAIMAECTEVIGKAKAASAKKEAA